MDRRPTAVPQDAQGPLQAAVRAGPLGCAMKGTLGVPSCTLKGAQVIARLRHEVDEVVIASTEGGPTGPTTKVTNASGRRSATFRDDPITCPTAIPEINDSGREFTLGVGGLAEGSSSGPSPLKRPNPTHRPLTRPAAFRVAKPFAQRRRIRQFSHISQSLRPRLCGGVICCLYVHCRVNRQRSFHLQYRFLPR